MANHTPLVEAWIRYAEDDWQDNQILASAGGEWAKHLFSRAAMHREAVQG
jgi:hypothetical protein